MFWHCPLFFNVFGLRRQSPGLTDDDVAGFFIAFLSSWAAAFLIGSHEPSYALVPTYVQVPTELKPSTIQPIAH